MPERLILAYEGQLAIILYSLLFSAGTSLNIVLLKVLSLEFIKVDGLVTCLNWEVLALTEDGLSYSPPCT